MQDWTSFISVEEIEGNAHFKDFDLKMNEVAGKVWMLDLDIKDEVCREFQDIEKEFKSFDEEYVEKASKLYLIKAKGYMRLIGFKPLLKDQIQIDSTKKHNCRLALLNDKWALYKFEKYSKVKAFVDLSFAVLLQLEEKIKEMIVSSFEKVSKRQESIQDENITLKHKLKILESTNVLLFNQTISLESDKHLMAV